MRTIKLLDATIKLVGGVLELIDTPPNDPHYSQRVQTVFGLCRSALGVCEVVLKAPAAYVEENAAVPVRQTKPAELGVHIAKLRAGGMGVREIARQLGVQPSTVSRRLRRT